MNKLPRPFHPFLFGLLYVAINVRDMQVAVPVGQTVACAAACLVAVYGIYRALRWFFPGVGKPSLLASLVFLGIAFTPGFYDFATETVRSLPALSWIRGRYVLALLVAAVGLAGVLVVRTQRDLTRLLQFLNLVSVAMLLGTIGETGYRLNRAGVGASRPGAGTTMRLQAPAGGCPDIYYIVLDAYTSGESLREFWKYDNSPFTGFLAGKGFKVVKDARSNVNYTFLSIATSLTMRYPPVVTNMFRKFCRETFSNAEVPRALQGVGYDFINLSLFDVAGQPNFYSYTVFSPGSLAKLLLQRSLMGLLWERLNSQSMADINMRIISALDKIAIRKQTAPRFVYAHLMMPHDPYVFDRDGNRVPSGGGERDERTAYLEQMLFVNRVMTNLVSRILDNSSARPIVVIQGDHGFRWLGGDDGKRESMTILNAYYLPESSPDWVYEGITPVNTFRLILNRYFGAKYEYLPDRSHALPLERGGMEL